MAQSLSIPVRLQSVKLPVSWQIVTANRMSQRHEFALGKIQPTTASEVLKLLPLDGWERREAFFSLRMGDNESLLGFLDSVGAWWHEEILSHWSPMISKHCREGHAAPIEVTGLWKFRDGLRKRLLNRKSFAEDYAPLMGLPKTELDLLRRDLNFPMRFEFGNVPAGVIETTDAYNMLRATMFLDVARGIRFKPCARKDCGLPFAIESKHSRKFCSQYCGHLVSQRKGRAKLKKDQAHTIKKPHPRR